MRASHDPRRSPVRARPVAALLAALAALALAAPMALAQDARAEQPAAGGASGSAPVCKARDPDAASERAEAMRRARARLEEARARGEANDAVVLSGRGHNYRPGTDVIGQLDRIRAEARRRSAARQ